MFTAEWLEHHVEIVVISCKIPNFYSSKWNKSCDLVRNFFLSKQSHFTPYNYVCSTFIIHLVKDLIQIISGSMNYWMQLTFEQNENKNSNDSWL